MSYSGLIADVCHDVAARFLRKTDTTVLETALETGNDDPPHYGRTFRHVAAISPLEYCLHYQQHQVYVSPAGGIEKKARVTVSPGLFQSGSGGRI